MSKGAIAWVWRNEAANRGLSVFVFSFALPLLLFRAIAQAELPDTLPLGYLLSYYLGAFAVFGLAMLATRVFDVPPLWVATAVTLAALPAGITPYLFAQRYEVCQATIASAVFLSTVVSVVTLSILLFLLRT